MAEEGQSGPRPPLDEETPAPAPAQPRPGRLAQPVPVPIAFAAEGQASRLLAAKQRAMRR